MTVKVGIMSFAHLHADSYALCLKQHPQAELVGIADHDATRAKAKAHQFETQAFSSYEALLASDVQAVIICSENAKHAPLAQMAAAAGKHILCEKPLMTHLEDGKAMLAAAQGAGVHLFTAFPCRFSPNNREPDPPTGKAGAESVQSRAVASTAGNSGDSGKCTVGSISRERGTQGTVSRAPVAQRIEQRPSKPLVVGSSPAGGASGVARPHTPLPIALPRDSSREESA